MAKTISLKTKMALAVSFLFVVFSASVAFFSISYFEEKTKKTLADQQYLLASSLADDIDDKLVILQSALVAASKKVPSDILNDAHRAQRFLEDRVTLHSLFDTTLFFLDKDGMLVAESPVVKERRVFNLAFREFHKKTVATRRPVISSPYASSLPGHRPIIMLTAPFFDRQGKLAGILCGGLRLLETNFLGEVRNIKIGTSGYVYLSTSDRVMIMHPDHSRILKIAALPGANKMFDRAIQGFDGSGETVNSSGIPMLSSFKHLTATDWVVGVNFPISEAYAPMYRTRQYLVGGIAAGTLAMLAIAWLVMKRLTAPLQAITRHVAALSEKSGKNRCITLESSDEIGTLAEAFNSMIADLDTRQEAVLESEFNFRTLAETANDGMLVIRGDGSFVYANGWIADITGYTTSELIQKGIRDLAHPDDCACLLERVAKIIDSESHVRQHETRIIRKDGVEVPVEVTSSRTLWQGEPADLAIIRDITERKRIEKALRDSHMLLQKTFASLNEAVFIVETGTRVILDCNATVETMFGYDRREIIGATTSRLHLSEEMSDRFGREMLDSYVKRGYFETAYRMKRKDGTVFDSEHYVTPIRDDSGEIVSHVCVVRDITERKRVEKSIIGLNRDLQQRANALAVANSELEAFGYSLSHDLKAPLTAIYSAAQTLEALCAGKMDDIGRFCVDTIGKASERMEELIDAMLLLSRISRSELLLEDNDLSVLAAEILLDLKHLEDDRIVEDVIAPGIVASGDRLLLKSALENLLGNAWKYSRNNEVTRIEFGMTVIDGTRAFFVSDNGTGFDMKNAETIFMPFKRLHQHKEFEGTGIGLTTVQRIIHRHGGKIWCSAEPGRGASFYFTLPENQI